jgi:hypothetical protein
VLSSFLLIVSISFIVSLYLAIFVATKLYIHDHTRKEGDIFFDGFVSGKKHLSMDFSKWRASSLTFFSRIYNNSFVHALDYYLIVLFLFCVINSSIYNILILFVITMFTTVMMIPALKKFSIREWSKVTLSTSMNIVNAILYAIITQYTLAAFFRPLLSESAGKDFLSNGLESYLWIIISNCLIIDLVKSKDYIENGRTIMAQREIEKKFIALYQAYDQNEKSILSRVKLVTKLMELDEIENKFWTERKNWKSLKFDPHYWHHSFEDTLSSKEEEVRSKSLEGWTKFSSKLSQVIYDYCHKKTSDYLFEDAIYILMRVIQKNNEVLKGDILDIEGFFEGDFKRCDEMYKEITSFYHYLRTQAASQTSVYKKYYDELIKFQKMNDAKLIRESRVLQKVAIMKSVPKAHPKYKETYTNKDSELLKKAVEILSDAIFTGTCGRVREANTEEYHILDKTIDWDKMDCDFGEYRMRFYNLTVKLTKHSKGYQSMKPSIFLEILVKFLVSRIEYFVALVVVLAQVYKGALENIFILGIIFFGILMETHHGHSKLWSIIYFIYLAKASLSYVEMNYTWLLGFLKESYRATSFISGHHSYIADSLILSLVFCLIQILNMRGFSEQYLISFEDVGTALARVGCDDLALYK